MPPCHLSLLLRLYINRYLMKISGFTYIRNGFTYGYPFIPSIKSLLPIVDELVVVVGDSTDGTREAIEQIGDPKIRIIDTVWDHNLRAGGKIFAEQSNLGLDNISGDWAVHLQADEVLLESSAEKIVEQIKQADQTRNIDGIIFPFLHFWGDYNHIRNTRRTHNYEIRAFRNTGNVRSYRDSQGFRKYTSVSAYRGGEKGEKLRVIKSEEPIYHYSYSRNPKLMKKKSNYFQRFWHSDQWLKEHTNNEQIDFNEVDRLDPFTKPHPGYMQEVIAQQDWEFTYDPAKSNMRLKDRVLNLIERRFKHRLFSYKNYLLTKPIPATKP
jgi:glycosyltransferase involved in cell wall biosynthesis